MNSLLRWMLLSLLPLSGLYAVEGQEVYETKCASCHALYHPLSTLEKNFMEEGNRLLNLKAPTMNQIVYRLKTRIGDPNGDEDIHLMEIESFLADYFENPDKEKSVCLPEVIQFFETMPPVTLDEEAFSAIVSFLYDYDPKAYQTAELVYLPYDSAKKKALKEGKIRVYFFTAAHCRYCKKMEREVLQDAEVIEALKEGFTVTRVDLDRAKNLTGFDVTMTPTFIFVSPSGETIYKVPGSWNKEDFLVILKEAKEKYAASPAKGAIK